MKMSARMIATMAVALLLIPAISLHAQAVGAVSNNSMAIAVDSSGGSDSQAQVGAPAPSPIRDSSGTPRVELFLGYSYIRAVPTLADGNRMVNLNGGSTSIALNFNRYIGLVGDFGGFDDTRLRLAGPGANPPRVADSEGTAYTYLFGPRVSFGKANRVVPFAQALFGGVHASEITLSGCTGSLCTPLPAQNAFAMTAGGGVDLRLSRHVALRVVQAEYLMTRFADLSGGSNNSQNDIRLSSGLVFRFGGRAPLIAVANHAPLTVCSVDSKTIYAGSGDGVAVHAHATDADNDRLNYSWTTNGGTVEGAGPEIRWNSSNAAPGTYTVSLRVDDGRGGIADCSADVRVETKPASPPTLSCTAERGSVSVGELVQVAGTANDADGNPLTFSWTASGGQIVGSGPSVKLDTSGLASGQYTVTGQVTDGHGGVADCSVHIDAQTPAPVPVPLEVRLALHSIYFPTAQPANHHLSEGLLASQQETLASLASDFATYRESKPNAQLILEGHADRRASAEFNQALSERRVESTKRFLIEHGVPAANIETKAFGMQRDLTDVQVKDAVEKNPELSPDQRQQVLDNMATIILASNRRVDVILSTTGQQSVRQYPFNAADSLTMLRQEKTP
jgi:outer membrane protein OmpA-like peptidoglycan-associated protein